MGLQRCSYRRLRDEGRGAIPKGMYPVKGVTVEDNEISGYGNGVSISLADTDTVTGNQIKMKKLLHIPIWVFMRRMPEER